MNEEEKFKDGLFAFSAFLDMLEGPNDIYKQIVITIFFEELAKYQIGSEFENENE